MKYASDDDDDDDDDSDNDSMRFKIDVKKLHGDDIDDVDIMILLKCK